ncbi:MAG: DUF2203 domain-containing protein [Planctomycetota bacterium]|nr:DUF2203 domain-containing protein [Planctomycetota bacterium]
MPGSKYYTVERAERALPLVRRIVQDLVDAFVAREKLLARRHALGAQPNPGSSAEETAFRLEREIDSQEASLRRYLAELELLGVELKDWRRGLIDFYSLYQGREVYLCWMLGEGKTLEHFHELQAGFGGRQPITPENRAEFKDSGREVPEAGPLPRRSR